MNLSTETKELFEALSKFQGELDNAKKNAVNPGVKNKYADLAQCINTAKPILAENGLAVIQMIGCSLSGKQTLITTMTHKSGQYMSSEFEMADAVLMGGAGKNPVQALGSAITYQRRYAFAAITGMAQEDDDGNSVHRQPPKQQAPQTSSTDNLKSFTHLIGATASTQALDKAKDDFFKNPQNKMNADDQGKAKAVYQSHKQDLESKGN